MWEREKESWSFGFGVLELGVVELEWRGRLGY
jgi:hypothetical protein